MAGVKRSFSSSYLPYLSYLGILQCSVTDTFLHFFAYISRVQSRQFHLMGFFHIIVYPFIDYGAFRVPLCGVGCTRLYRTPALRASPSCGSRLVWPQIVNAIFTHSDHVFLGLPYYLLPETTQFVTNMIQDRVRCAWPYHLGCRLPQYPQCSMCTWGIHIYC